MSLKDNVRLGIFAGGGVLVGLVAAYALSLPRIDVLAPASEDASTRAVIEIHFTRPMRPETVEARFATAPPIDGTFDWPDAQTIRFQPEIPLDADSQYELRLAAGAVTERGARLPWGARSSFQTGHPTLLYLADVPLSDGQVTLWRVEPDGSEPRPLAELTSTQSIHSYDVNPEGTQIALSLEREDGGADLALLSRTGGVPERLLECPGSACIEPRWSPDGARIAYEQRALVVSDVGPSRLTGQVWVLDVGTGIAEPIVARDVQSGTAPSWSPDGTRLAFHDGQLRATIVFDLTAERFSEDRVQVVPHLEGGRVAWSTDGETILFSEMFLDDEEAQLLAGHAEEHNPETPHEEPTPSITYLHLVQYAFGDESLSDLSGDLEVEDGTPVYSPDGRWLAFGRRTLGGEDTTFGRQLWIMDLETGENVPLLDEPTYNHGAYAWSPDSRHVAYMRFNRLDPRARADIWIVDVTDGEAHPLVEGAFLPAWLP